MHVCISTGVGLRLPAASPGVSGRHLRILAMYTVSRVSPIVWMILVSNCPALPTNGSPCASSSAPGASPTNINSASILPTPNTTFFRELAKWGHFTQANARARSSAKAALRASEVSSGNETLGAAGTLTALGASAGRGSSSKALRLVAA
jgi:hypothetical protein